MEIPMNKWDKKKVSIAEPMMKVDEKIKYSDHNFLISFN